MARRRRRGGRRGPLKGIGRWVNAGFKIAGAVVIASPAFKPVQTAMGNQGQTLGPDILYSYTGIYTGGGGGINTGQTITGLGSIAGGILLMKLGGFLGKQFR